MKWRPIYSCGTYRYHIGRMNVVIQRTVPWSDKKLVVPFTTLLGLPEEKIFWTDDGRLKRPKMLVGIEPSDIQKYIDASPLEAFEQPKQKKRK